MLEKVKEWLFDETEEMDDQRINDRENSSFKLIRRDITDLNQLITIGDDFKNMNILLYYFSNGIIMRALDFISG